MEYSEFGFSASPNMDHFGTAMENIDAEEMIFRERIRDAIQAGGKAALMSEKTGIAKGTLAKYVAMTSTASAHNARKIALAVGLTLDGLYNGDLERPRKNPHLELPVSGESGLPSRAQMEAALSGQVAVPAFDVQAAAGVGLIPINEIQGEPIILDRNLLRRHGVTISSCVVLTSKGESMLPTIPDGSPMVIDTGDVDIADDEVYVFRVGQAILVKRARWRMDGGLDLVSDNEAAGYPAESFPPSATTDLHPIGRVALILRTARRG